MKKKIFLIFSSLMLIPFNLFAGGFSINVGVNHSWLYYPEISALQNKFNPNFSIGINYNQSLFTKLELSYGVRYFKIGRYDEISNSYLTETVRMNHSYISLPVKLEYNLINNIIPFVNIEPAFQIHSNYEHTNTWGLNDNRTVTDEMNGFNLFAGAGIKYQFVIAEQNFSISGLINFGLIRISKAGTFNSSYGWADWRGREISFSLGYYFVI